MEYRTKLKLIQWIIKRILDFFQFHHLFIVLNLSKLRGADSHDIFSPYKNELSIYWIPPSIGKFLVAFSNLQKIFFFVTLH